MKHLVAATAVALSFGMSAANASDLYHLRVEYLLGGKIIGQYSSDVPLGEKYNFSRTHSRTIKPEMTFVDGVKVFEVKEPIKTGFLFNGLPTLTSEGKLLFTYDYSYSREEELDAKSDGAANLHLPTIRTTSVGSSVLVKPGELTSLGITGGRGPDFEVKMMLTKL